MNKKESKYFRTADAMDDALLEMLCKKDYEFISVKEICAISHVNRSTFYLHYENMDDLLKETATRLEKEFFSSFNIAPIDVTNISIANKKDFIFIRSEYLKPYLEYIYNNRKVFKILVNRPELFNIADVFSSMYRKYFEPIMCAWNIKKDEQPYFVDFYCHGIIAIVNRWLDNNCSKSIDYVIEIIDQCTQINDVIDKLKL